MQFFRLTQATQTASDRYTGGVDGLRITQFSKLIEKNLFSSDEVV
jgi:hypothetical protein